MKFETTIANELGMHADAAIQFVQTASKFKSNIRVFHKNKEADGKNVIKLLGLRIEKNSHITVIAEGEDEQLALQELKMLVDNNFWDERYSPDRHQK
ncbi:MAG TPA: HPr family phosphocarrier protein [Clostridiales bacterium]|nr:HPr family phosphocarrier protein [Clostridiales bacterium]